MTVAQDLRTILSSSTERRFDFNIDMKEKGRAAIIGNEAEDVVYLTLVEESGGANTQATTFLKIKDFSQPTFTYQAFELFSGT